LLADSIVLPPRASRLGFDLRCAINMPPATPAAAAPAAIAGPFAFEAMLPSGTPEAVPLPLRDCERLRVDPERLRADATLLRADDEFPPRAEDALPRPDRCFEVLREDEPPDEFGVRPAPCAFVCAMTSPPE
jgi:hypothetical protein